MSSIGRNTVFVGQNFFKPAVDLVENVCSATNTVVESVCGIFRLDVMSFFSVHSGSTRTNRSTVKSAMYVWTNDWSKTTNADPTRATMNAPSAWRFVRTFEIIPYVLAL